MANEKIKYETVDDNIPPEKRIAKFIHLMSEGINHHQVVCNGVTITLEYSETESSEDMVNCTMYMTKEDLELKGYSFFKFFYRVAGILLSKGILKVTDGTQRTIGLMNPLFATMNAIDRMKFVNECIMYAYAFKMQAFSGPLNIYLPEKPTPDENDPHFEEIDNYNTNIKTIRSYCRHVESESNKRAKENSIKVSRSVSEIIGSGSTRKKKKDETTNKHETCLDKLTRLLHIQPLHYEYDRRLERLIEAIETGNPSLFYTSYEIKEIKHSKVTNDNGEEIEVSHPDTKTIKLPKNHPETIKRLYESYVPYLKRYLELMGSTNSMLEINRYTGIVEKICYHGYPSKVTYVPRGIRESDIQYFEESMIDRSVEHNVKKICMQQGLITANEWNEIRKSNNK